MNRWKYFVVVKINSQSVYTNIIQSTASGNFQIVSTVAFIYIKKKNEGRIIFKTNIFLNKKFCESNNQKMMSPPF